LKISISESADPRGIAFRCGMEYHENSDVSYFLFSIFDISVKIKYPQLIAYNNDDGSCLNTAYQALVCYYMSTSVFSDGFPIAGRWVSFAELPDGRFYNQAFQGYTGNKLASSIESDIIRFSKVAIQLYGSPLEVGDSSYKFSALPKVPLAVVYWGGDEDFPPSCKILFDASVSWYLPTDACAILGSMLTQKILKHLNE
jgi:hypothetical protein